MTSLLDYVEEKIRESDNPFQSDYRSEVDTLIALAFPSTQKPRQKNVGIGRIDTDSMSEEEYNRWFQGQGRLAESHPIASVVGPLKGANLLRKLALRKRVNPHPTTAPLAITDQTQAPLAEPLRLEGPPDLPMLTYDGGEDNNPPPIQDLAPDEADAAERQWNAWQNQLMDEHYLGLEAATEDDDEHEFGAAFDYIPNEGVDIEDDPPWEVGNYDDSIISDKEFYTQPEGYYSVLDKIIAEDSLTKAEKESAVREMKYRTMSSDDKLFDEVIHDPTRDIYAEMTADEEGNIIASPIPGINDIEAIKKFKEEKPLEFTVRHSADTVGGEPGDKATHLYFGGTNLKRQSEEFREHFFTNGRPAQAFITYNEKGGSFNIEESQSEMRGEGNPYMNQVVTKLAQQTVLDWAKTGLNTITIPTGEAIFDKYYSTQGRGLWADESKLLRLKDNNEFDKKAQEFYNQPILQEEINKDVRQHISLLKHLINLGESIEGPLDGMRDSYGVEYGDMILEIVNKTNMTSPSYTEKNANHQDAVDIFTLHRIKKLKDLKGNYQGKVKHYNEYVKQVKKALKQQGAKFSEGGLRDLDADKDDSVILELTNPEETKRKTEIDGFPMAMLLKKTKKRQVA